MTRGEGGGGRGRGRGGGKQEGEERGGLEQEIKGDWGEAGGQRREGGKG